MKAKQTCAYLYADGHAVIVYEQEVKLGKATDTVEYVVIHEKWTQASLSFKGRITLSRYGSSAMLDLAKRACHIVAKERSVEQGSDATKRLGIELGTLIFDFPAGGCLYFHDSSVLSGQYHYQPECVEAFDASAVRRGNHRVAEIKRATKNPATVTA